ncbi:hypothetical protein BDV19DRAFT_362116 [Aspergillus venezuelensis]
MSICSLATLLMAAFRSCGVRNQAVIGLSGRMNQTATPRRHVAEPKMMCSYCHGDRLPFILPISHIIGAQTRFARLMADNQMVMRRGCSCGRYHIAVIRENAGDTLA